MTLLRLEFFKGRRRKIAIICLACLGIQTAWMVVDLLRMEPEELAQGWMQLVYTLLLVDAITEVSLASWTRHRELRRRADEEMALVAEELGA